MLQFLRTLILLILWASTANCTDFKSEVLALHNYFRKIHGVPPLRLDDVLSEKADELAKLASANGNLTKPQPGENTYMLCTSYNRAVTSKEAVSAWYDEVCNAGYSFDDPNNDNAHAFTQATWKDSMRLGVAKSTAKDVGADGLKCTYIVALYRPPGNIELTGAKDTDELFKENIFKGSFNSSYCDKFNDNNKRQLIEDSFTGKEGNSQSFKVKRSISDDTDRSRQFDYQHEDESDTVHPIVRRTLYYKIPAKFYIDSETGQTKIVSALGERLAYTKSRFKLPAGIGKDEISVIQPDLHPSSSYKGNSNDQSSNAEEFDDGLVNNEDAIPTVSAPATMSAESRGVIETLYNENERSDKDLERTNMLGVALRVHNLLRKIHGSQPLRLSTELSRAAQAQAEQNAALHMLSHATDLGILLQGENLAYNCKGENEVAHIQESIKDWYNEVCKSPYDFNNEDSRDALHFTQVVWNSTRLLGCGKAIAKRSIAGSSLTCTYFCCRYGPTGNMYGDFKKNVIRGSFDRDSTCTLIPGSINITANVPGIYLSTNENVGETISTNSSGTADNNKIYMHEEQVGRQEEKLQLDALLMHNYLRHIHGSQPLKLDKGLSKTAKNWAKYIASTDSLKHSKADDYGENIAFSCSGNKVVASVNDSVHDWYDEVCAHEYDFLGDMQQDTLHFTQVLWNDSSKLGIGMATSINNGMYCTYFVAQYKPKGNIIGHFVKNIMKGNFQRTKGCLGQRSFLPEKVNTTQDMGHEHFGEKAFTGAPIDAPSQQSSTEDLQDQDEKDYEFDAIKVLNKIRQIHEAPPLSEEFKLHMDAKDRAATFVTGTVRMIKNQSHIGEIVQVACNPLDRVLPPEEAIANWYSEVCVKGYNFANDIPQNAFHFTQLIWRSSEKIGIAYSTKKKRNGNLCTVVIALFEPGGNVENEFAENIHKGSFDKSFCGSINSIAVSALDSDTYRTKGQNHWAHLAA